MNWFIQEAFKQDIEILKNSPVSKISIDENEDRIHALSRELIHVKNTPRLHREWRQKFDDETMAEIWRLNDELLVLKKDWEQYLEVCRELQEYPLGHLYQRVLDCEQKIKSLLKIQDCSDTVVVIKNKLSELTASKYEFESIRNAYLRAAEKRQKILDTFNIDIISS